MTLRSLLWDQYRPRRMNLSRKAALQLQYSIVSLERFAGRELTPAELSEDLFLRWIMHRLDTASRSTAKRDRSNLLTLWRFAHRKGLCPTPAPDDTESIRLPKRIPRAWTMDELGKLVAACRAVKGWMPGLGIRRCHWWTSLILFLYDSGSRIGAALNVRTNDVSLIDRHVLLRAESAKTGVEQLCDLSDETCAELAEHFDPAREYLFPWPRKRSQLFVASKRLHKLAGVDASRGVGFHRIRKTTATQTVIAVGWEQARVALGHAAESMTKVYVDLRQIGRPKYDLPRPPRPAGVEGPRQPRLTYRPDPEPTSAPEPAELRHPEAVDPTEWKFGLGSFTFRGRLYELRSGALLELLKMFSRQPTVSWREVLRSVTGFADEHGKTGHATAYTQIGRLRRVLIRQLSLPDGFNPLPSVAARNGVWALRMPVERDKKVG